jgi:small-conductance mechanosensitive channel
MRQDVQQLADRATSLLRDHPSLLVLLVLVATVLVAKLVNWLLARVILVWARRTKTELDERIVELLRRPVQVSIVLVGLGLVTPLLALPVRVQWVTIAALWTVAILVWTSFALRFVPLVLEGLSHLEERYRVVEPRTLALFQNLSTVLLAGLGVYFLFLAWRIDVTAWLASAGIIGIAVGFAAKDTLANLFSGVFILADAPYKVGDFINLDTGERGRVTQVGLRSTRLLTRDDVEITIPNAVIANAKIVNESGGPWQKERIRIKVGVAYGSDLQATRAVLLEAATEHPDVCAEPEPRVRFRSFGDSGLDHELLCWIDGPVLRGRVTDALNTAVYEKLNAAGIEIPYPKRDVYLHWAEGHEPPRR